MQNKGKISINSYRSDGHQGDNHKETPGGYSMALVTRYSDILQVFVPIGCKTHMG